MATVARRFGVREVKKGPFKGSLHRASSQHVSFMGELTYLSMYLSHRLLPMEPEELTVQGIALILENILEHELEMLIAHVAQSSGNRKDQEFQKKVFEGYVSFKTKFEWLRSRGAIDQGDFNILEDVRVLRNSLAHIRPTRSRRRLRYQGYPLLTKHSLRKLLCDVELTLRNIRNRSGRSARWMTAPPDYADELNWPTEYVKAFKKKTP